MFTVLNNVIDNYQDGALIAMFDCIGTIAQQVGDGLTNSEVLQPLMYLLNKKWE